MAKKSNRNSRRSRGMTKIQPAVKTMSFILNAGTSFIDLSQCASLLNRRFYRQGLNWAVGGFRISKATPTETGSSFVNISRLPDTWILSNSWEKSFRSWSKMINKATEETESVKPRFLDYKIYMNDEHHLAGFGANLLPRTNQGSTAKLGEWEASKVYIPDTTLVGNAREREIVAIGASYPATGASGLNAVSMVEGYAASRGLPNVLDPNTPDDAADIEGIAPENWMAAIFNEGTSQDSDVVEDLIEENNVAPYPFENGPDPLVPGTFYTDTQYPGGANNLFGPQIVDVGYFNAGTHASKLYLKGDSFPCGLVRIDTDVAAQMLLQIDLVPGSHRGYLCQSMTEM